MTDCWLYVEHLLMEKQACEKAYNIIHSIGHSILLENVRFNIPCNDPERLMILRLLDGSLLLKFFI